MVVVVYRSARQVVALEGAGSTPRDHPKRQRRRWRVGLLTGLRTGSLLARVEVGAGAGAACSISIEPTRSRASRLPLRQ